MHYGNKHCAYCNQQATHKFTRVREGKVDDIYLCAEHAAENSPYQKQAPQTHLSEILKQILKQELTEKEQRNTQAPLDLRCSHCGLNYREYKKNLILGCSECYLAFRPFLVLDLRRIHGATQHLGRKPGGGQQEPIEVREELPKGLIEMESAVSVTKPAAAAPPAMQVPPSADELNRDTREAIDKLKRLMNMAIAEENFAKAGMCRDQIRQLQKKLEQREKAQSE